MTQNDTFGLGAYPAISPPSGIAGSGAGPYNQPGLPNVPPPMATNTALAFMGPNGLPWARQPLSTLNNPTSVYANPLIGKVNTGSATYPDPPQPAVNDQNQPTGAVPQAPSDSASGPDMLTTIRDTIGGIARSALAPFEQTGRFIARPTYEALFHPGSFLDALNSVQGVGLDSIGQRADALNRKFEEEQDPGIVKFVGETAFDPLTYLGIGEVGAAAKIAGKIPLAGHVLEPAVTAAGNYLLLPSKAVEKVGDVAGPLLNMPATITSPASGLLNNYIPFHDAKDSASKILGAFLPTDTVKSILLAIPNEYTGIPIRMVTDPINAQFPKLGLPDVLKVPEVRDIKVAQSVMVSRDALLSTMADYGINPGAAGVNDLVYTKKMIDSIFVRPPDSLPPYARVIQDVLKRPVPLGEGAFTGIQKLVGGNIEYDGARGLELNRIVSQFRRGPSVADPATGISETDAVQRVAQLVGADFKANPDIGYDISRFLQAKTDESRLLRNRLGRMAPVDLANEVAMRTSTLTKGEWDLGIQVQRAQGNLWDQLLNNVDHTYTDVIKGVLINQISAPLSGAYLNFTLFNPLNVAEEYVRNGLAGGGWTVRRLDNQSFAAENAGIADVPPHLMQYTPSERAQVGLAQNIERKGSGPIRTLVALNPLDKMFEGVGDTANNLETMIRRSGWHTMFDRSLDNVLFSKGLSARPDFSTYMDAVKSPDVTAVPELAGVDQGLVNDLSKQTIKVLHNTDLLESLKTSVDSGFYNREKAATIIDGPGFEDLHPSSKQIWYNRARVATSSDDYTAAANAVVDNEKALALSAPDVIASKFEGLADYIQDAGSKPGFNISDMVHALSHVNDMQTQFAGIPELIRQMEYDAIDRALHRNGDSWRQAIHDDFNNRFQDALDKVGTQLERASTSLDALGTRYGMSPEVKAYTTSLRADNQLTIDTWSKDLAMQREFFAKMGKSRNMRQMVNWDDYYAMRRGIWGDYGAQREVLRTEQANLQAAINEKVRGFSDVTGSIPSNADVTPPDPAILKAAQTKLNRASAAHKRFNSEKTAATLADAQAGVDRLTNPPEVPVSVPTEPIEPGIDAAVRHVTDHIDAGADTDHIASADYNSIINAARDSGAEPPTNARSSTSGKAVSYADPTQPIASGSNGPSATVGTATPDITAGLYATADSYRQRLMDGVIDAVNNPVIKPEQAKYLTDWMDNAKSEFESLNVENQRVLTDSVKEAGQRARRMYDNAFVDYDGRNKFDWTMQHVFPFWMYESRRWPYLLRTGLAKPALPAIYANYMNQTNQGYIPIGETPFQINPLRGTVLGSINRLQQQDRPLQYTQGLQGALDSIDATLGKVGLYTGPLISIPSNIIRGAAGASVPPGINTIVNVAHGLNVPVLSATAGAIEQSVLPSPFRDYYTRMILASQQLEPDKVYQSSLDGDVNAQSALDAAGRQADLVGAILEQTGVLRFKTQEYQQYQDARTNAITNMTGITKEAQDALQQAGTPLNQVVQLTPEQREQLNALQGTKEFSQISQPLLNPAAARLQLNQRNFYDALDKERATTLDEQAGDDRRLQNGIISGIEWRKRYQDRSGRLSTMFDDLRKLPGYDQIPVTPEQQVAARTRYNLPAYVDSPVNIALNDYYGVKPETDAVTGDVNWTKFFDDRSAVLARYPTLQAELDRRSTNRDTAQVRDFKAASETLRQYFQIKDQIIQRMPQLGEAANTAQMLTNADPIQGRVYAQNNPEVQTLNKLVQYYQRQMRMQNPQVDQALVRYYGSTPIQYQMMQSGGAHTNTGIAKVR